MLVMVNGGDGKGAFSAFPAAPCHDKTIPVA